MPATYLLFLSVFFGFILTSSTTSADETVDRIDVNVPISCSLAGTGMDSHTTSLMNGNYATDVGTTTLKALCNDNEGFAIYAIGYTDDTDGKTVMSSSTLGDEYDIVTGTGTSGNSQWAMKLSTQTSPEPTYPISIVNNYNQYHVVPDDYELVAKRTSATDVGTTAIGSTLTSTYQIYVSTLQPAGTYIGKVKYVMVHPYTAPQPVGENQIGVIYDGNGLFFNQAGTKSANRVVYEESCEDQYGYIGNTPAILKTRNLNSDGTQNGPYNTGTYYDGDGTDPNYVEFEGASRIKVVVRYGLTQETTGWFDINIDGYSIKNEDFYTIYDGEINRSGTATYVAEGSSAGVHMEVWGTPNPDYDYGLYVQVYPIYDEPTDGATYDVTHSICSYHPVNGAYAETIPWYGFWYKEEEDGYTNDFYYEMEDDYGDDYFGIVSYLNRNSNNLKGTTITVHAYYPHKAMYDGNSATIGTMESFESIESSNRLIAPNYLKTGYGFVGWSEDPSATANGNSTIFGPTEIVDYSNLSYDNNKTATLYAVWEQSAGNIQNWGGCSTMNIGEVTALTDIRDNNTYAVAKLDDGKCWMIENLRLDLSDENTVINANNTHNPTSAFLEERQSVIGLNTTRKSCEVENQDCINQISYDKSYIDNTLTPNPTNYSSSWFANGVLYNWYTSTAGNGTYSTYSESVTGDICPSGWRMPSGTNNGDLYNFMASIGTVSVRRGEYSVATDKATKFPYNGILYDDYIHFTSYSSTSGGIQTATGAGIGRFSTFLQIGEEEIKFFHIGNAFSGDSAIRRYNTAPVRCLTD